MADKEKKTEFPASGQLESENKTEFPASGQLESEKKIEFPAAGNSKIGELEAGNSGGELVMYPSQTMSGKH